MSKSLIEAQGEFNSILKEIYANDGEITEDAEARLDEVQKRLAGKADAYHYVLEHLQQEEKWWANRIQKYQQTKRAIASARAKLKERLLFTMQNLHVDELAGDEIKWRRVNTQKRLTIENEGLIPVTYLEEKTEHVVQKDEIKKAIERGEEISGAKLEGGETVRAYPNRGGTK